MAAIRFTRGLAPCLLVLVLFAYARALHAPFVSDDALYLSQNQKLLTLPASGLWKLFVEPFNPFEFLPLRDFSYWLDLSLFGLNPAALRIHNMVLYVIASFLAFMVTYRLCNRFQPDSWAASAWTAAIATSLFVVHPAHVEAVVWLSGRKDLLAGIFSLSALWMTLELDGRVRRAAILIAGIVLATLGALFSKATAIVITPLLILLALMHFRNNTKNIARPILLALALAPLVSALLFFSVFYQSSSITVPQYYGMELIERFFAILGWLTRLSISFEQRHFFYPVLDTPATPFMVAIGILVLLLALVGLVFVARKNSLRGFAATAFFILCLPYCQLIPFGTHSLASDRHLFLAVWPVCLLLASVPRKIFYQLGLLMLGVAWLAETMARPAAWLGFDELVQRDVISWPGYAPPLAYAASSILAPAGKVDEAYKAAQAISRQDIRQFVTLMIETSAAVKRSTSDRSALDKSMSRLWQLGEVLDTPPADAKWNIPILYIYHVLGGETVKKLWTTLTEAYPDHAALNYNAGLWFQKRGHDALAEKRFHAAINLLDPDSESYGPAAKNWGMSLWATGDKSGAEKAFKLALQAPKPDFRAACLLASFLSESQGHQEAVRYKIICDKLKTSDQASHMTLR